MKQTLFTFMALAMAFAVTSCQSEEELPLEELPQEPTNGTIGTAKATIDGKQVDVKWVQLWSGGPKFAEKNLGATSATGVGNTYQFSATGANDKAATTWGDNWRTPSQGQMNELMKAATSGGSTKVKCQYIEEGGVFGFKFTGNGDYASNSVFFPAQSGYSFHGHAYYWSGSANGSKAWYMLLYNRYGNWFSDWNSDYQDNNYLVRPVLKN